MAWQRGGFARRDGEARWTPAGIGLFGAGRGSGGLLFILPGDDRRAIDLPGGSISGSSPGLQVDVRLDQFMLLQRSGKTSDLNTQVSLPWVALLVQWSCGIALLDDVMQQVPAMTWSQ